MNNETTPRPSLDHDPIAAMATAAAELGRPTTVIEIFEGTPRTHLPNDSESKIHMVCANLAEAKRLQAALSPEQRLNTTITVASAHALPFANNSGDLVVDAHRMSHVGWSKTDTRAIIPTPEHQLLSMSADGKLTARAGASNYQTPGTRLGHLAQEVAQLVPGVVLARPTFLEQVDHDRWKQLFADSLKAHARLLQPGGHMVFSVATTTPGTPATDNYWAIHHQEGEVVLSKAEIIELLREAGLEPEIIPEIAPEGLLPSVAPKSQAIAAESAFKAFIMTLAGGDNFKSMLTEKVLPFLHKAMNLIPKFAPKPKPEVASERASGVGSLFDSPPDRYVVIAKKLNS